MAQSLAGAEAAATVPVPFPPLQERLRPDGTVMQFVELRQYNVELLWHLQTDAVRHTFITFKHSHTDIHSHTHQGLGHAVVGFGPDSDRGGGGGCARAAGPLTRSGLGRSRGGGH